jgi:hypothetical protein
VESAVEDVGVGGHVGRYSKYLSDH